MGMGKRTTEYRLEINDNGSVIRIRKQNRDFSRYFGDLPEEEPLNDTVLSVLLEDALRKTDHPIVLREKYIDQEIVLASQETDHKALESFTEASLDVLELFYEEHEVHVTRMFGSFIYLKRVDGALTAVKATPVPIRYCPLMKKLLKEVGGDAAEQLLSAVETGDVTTQTDMMCRLINEVVIQGGYFDTSRPLNSCEANVLFGASETMSTAFRSGLIDAAVIVSNNLGTIITTDESNTQGAVKRMTGLFLTSPSREIVKTAREAKIIPVFPHTAAIDQLEGVKLAITLGYKKIAVSIAWLDNILLNEISALEKDGITIYKFGLCSTGIDEKTAEAMEYHADLIWSCASKVVRMYIEPNAVAQVGVKIPVHIMTEKGWLLVKNHLDLTDRDRGGKVIDYDNVLCRRGPDKPVIMNDENSFRIVAAKDLKECLDCPHPCV
jgi:putative methanogenesis marker protein 8